MSTKFSFSGAVRTLLAGLCVLAAVGVQAAAQAQTLERIKKAGVVRIGVHGESAPWGYIDANGNNVGYDVDVARLVAEELGAKLELVINVSSARIPNLLTNKVDLQMAIMGMYPDRAKVVQYSKPYAGLQNTLVASKKLKIESNDDLVNLVKQRNLRIGTPRATAQEVVLVNLLGDVSNIRRFDDDISTIQALISGQADAVGANSTYKITLDRLAPGNDFEDKLVWQQQWQGITSRLKDKKMNEWLNQFIDKIKADGRLEAISQKHLGMPLPEFPESVEGVPFTVQ